MKNKIIIIFWIVLCLGHINGVLGQQKKATTRHSRPNVLFLFVDDLRADFGAYGNTIVHTPHLDSLAKQGLLFTNQYANVPTCGASRYALLTGKYPVSKRHLDNEVIANELSHLPKSEVPESFIDHMRRNGYKTIGIGKISHSADGYVYPYTGERSDVLELPHSWDEMIFNPGRWKTGWHAFFAQADGSSRISREGNTKPYEKANVEDKGYPDGLTAEMAVHKIKELAKQEEPFFLGVGFFKPHLPFNAPKKYWDLYNEEDIPLSKSLDLPKNVERASLTESNEIKQYKLADEQPSLDKPVSEEYARKLIHGYYASISYVDAMIGRVLSTLREEGLDKNTIIIVWGDHGWQLGDHRVWGKHTLFDVSLKSAYIIKLPNDPNQGRVIDDVISSVDLYPTLMELCGIEMPQIEYDGASYVKLLLKGKDKKWKNSAYGYFNQGISLKTPRYRITKYFRDAENTIELYDHKKDPYENVSIAEKRPKVVKKLLRELNKGDTGLYQDK